MGGNGEGAGNRLEKGLGTQGGGGWGFGYYLPQGWVSSPAASPALCMVRGAAPAWGGYSPSLWQGPVVPGQAMGWEPMEDMSCESLLEAPGSFLGSSPGSSPDSRAVDLQCQGEHCAMGQRGSRVPCVVGCRDTRLQG